MEVSKKTSQIKTSFIMKEKIDLPPQLSMDKIPILTERPEGMEFEEYKQRLKAQNAMIKLYKKMGRWRIK